MLSAPRTENCQAICAPFLSSSDKPASCWIRRHLQRHLETSQRGLEAQSLKMCYVANVRSTSTLATRHRSKGTSDLLYTNLLRYYAKNRQCLLSDALSLGNWKTRLLQVFSSASFTASASRFHEVAKTSTHPTLPCQKCAHAQSHPGSFFCWYKCGFLVWVLWGGTS